MVIDHVVLRSRNSPQKRTTFLTEWLDERVKPIKVPLPIGEGAELPASSIPMGGRQCELLAAEVKDEGKGLYGQTKQVYMMYYVETSGDDLTTIDLREELEKLAAFDGQVSTVRKTLSRLLLFESEAKQGMALRLKADDFELLPDEPMSLEDGSEMLDGCGFIPDEMLLRLVGGGTGALTSLRSLIKAEGLGVKQNVVKGQRELHDIVAEIEEARTAKMGDATVSRPAPAIGAALKHIAIQVRVFGSQIGVVKGMLMRKQGISKIQLPPSMVKVGASLRSSGGTGDDVSLIIKQQFPSANNILIDKVLRGEELSTSARKQLEDALQKKWAHDDMIPRLLYSLGVPKKALDAHLRKPVEEASRAWVVGVADPSNLLPAGHIFVTGLQPTLTRSAISKVFVTRSPCLKPADGRMLPVVTERPPAMDPHDWEWMLQLQFGAVIFSGLGGAWLRPIPADLANGDLDGDHYFMCWDEALLAHVRERELASTSDAAVIESEEHPALEAEDKEPIERGDGWLAQVQRKLTDGSLIREKSRVGRLYNAMKKRVGEAEAGMDDPDALALGAATVQALEREKHGGAIRLPKHLHDKFR